MTDVPMSSPESITLFITGVTSLVKKLGVKGNWLVLVCFIAGGVATTMTTYQPELWAKLVGIVVSATAAGNVALLEDFAKKLAIYLRG